MRYSLEKPCDENPNDYLLPLPRIPTMDPSKLSTGSVPLSPGKSMSNLLIFCRDNRLGYMDVCGNVRIAPKYEAADLFSDGLAAVKDCGAWGYINSVGETVIPFRYKEAGPFDGGTAAVRCGNGYGVIDQRGQFLVPPVYESAAPFSHGLSLVLLHDKYGYVTAENKVAIPFLYDDSSGFDEKGWALVERRGIRQFIDTAGRVVLDVGGYDAADAFFDDLAIVAADGKYGYVDRTGRMAIPLVYDGACPAAQGLLGVKRDGHWGFVDENRKTVVAFRYDDVAPFECGMARVCRRDLWGLIDLAGREVLPCEYEDIADYGEDYIHVIENGSNQFYLTRSGEKIVPKTQQN